MTSALTPEQAHQELLDLSADIRECVVLDAAGSRLAGPLALAGPASQLVAASAEPEIEVGTGRGSVFASRSPQAAVVAVAERTALPALMLYDLRVVLARVRVPAARPAPKPGAGR
jgi:hypothetical protein